jgi:hypothetical protein
MSGVPLGTCSAFNKLPINKFYYKLHLADISTDSYYDARTHEYQLSIVALFIESNVEFLKIMIVQYVYNMYTRIYLY